MSTTHRSRFPGLMVLGLSFLLIPALLAGSENVSGHSAFGSFLPQTVTLQPSQIIDPPAPWATASCSIHPESDSIQFPLPALAAQDQIGCFALTAVFEDLGDGGPVLEWISREGQLTLLSAGLAENGVALGLNARTVVIPQSLTLDGGVVKVSYPGRFSRMISTTLRPARELGVAVLGTDSSPALIQENQQVLSEGEVSGLDEKLLPGDRADRRVIHADLATAPLRIDQSESGGITEFIVPLTDTPQGSMLHAEVGGLDPESWIEVAINGESRGVLSLAPFELQNPGVVFSTEGHLLLAGWRRASLFLPARLWHEGDNSLVLTLHRSAGDAGKAVHVRKVSCDYLFNPTPVASGASPKPSAPLSSASPSLSPAAVSTSATPSDTLSTLSNGSQYGNPSPSMFQTSKPAALMPAPSAPPATSAAPVTQ